MNTTQRAIALLLRSGITGEKLKMPEGFVLGEAYELLVKHSVAPLAYQGALNCGFMQTEETMQKLFRAYYQALVRSEKQLRALEKLFAAFEAQGIPFMPVKGCIMKKLYPQPELRAMGDADILIHPEDHDRIRPLMEENGFMFDQENEHIFLWRSEITMIELHKSLIPPYDKDYYAQYGTGWKLAKQSNSSRCKMSEEDTYVFMFTHFARHYRHSGIGCRHVVDLFVCRKSFEKMDWTYVNEELTKLGLSKFHENVMQMIQVWFEDKPGNEITELITDFVFSSGNWGSYKSALYLKEVRNVEQKGEVKNSNFRVFMRSVFPPLQTMVQIYYDWLTKYPFLLPVCWVMRIFKVLFKQPRRMLRKLGVLRSIDDEGVMSYQQAMTKVGLDFGTGRAEKEEKQSAE